MSQPERDQNGPSDTNPVLSAYESFVRETPLVTRLTITILTISYFLSYVTDIATSLGNVPRFTLLKFELYRIVLSPFVCVDLLNLVFAYMSFMAQGKKLEYGIGSTAFGFLILTIGSLTNIIYIVISCILWGITGEIGFMFGNSMGIWTVLFGIISIECSMIYKSTPTRSVFGLNVPTLYYPMILLFLFSLFGSVSFPYMISMALGYAYGFQKLTFLKLGCTRRKNWETTFLKKFTDDEGFVYGPASSEWNDELTSGEQGWSPTTIQSSSTQNIAAETTTTDPVFSGSGHRLGNPTRRSNAPRSSLTLQNPSSDREAILAAAERRAEAMKESDLTNAEEKV